MLVTNTDSSDNDPGNQTHGSTMDKDNLPSQTKTSETSDILMMPKLLNNGNISGTEADGIQNGGSTVSNLRAIQQATILAKCLLIEKSSRSDEMQSECVMQNFCVLSVSFLVAILMNKRLKSLAPMKKFSEALTKPFSFKSYIYIYMRRTYE